MVPRAATATARRSEVPWLLGVGLAVALLQVLAHEAPGFPFGSDWGQYLQGADALWRADHSAPYPSWRGPLYMFLLGGAGQKLGYVVAGRLVSRVAAALCVIAAGLAGRVLGGRGAAIAAAFSVALFAPMQQAAVWVNPYATMGATWGLALAAGLATARWGWRWTAIAAGLMGGAAVATDPRGWQIVPLVLLLGLLAPPPKPGKDRMVSPGLLFIALLLTVASALWVQRDLPQTPLHQAIQEQHVLSAEMVGIKTGPYHPLAACLEDDSASGRMVTTWTCAHHLMRWNFERMTPRGYLPPWWFVLALPLLLLNWGGWAWRGALARGVAVGLPLVAMVAGVAWVEWAPRYSAPYVVPLALLGPVVAARLFPGRRGDAWSFVQLGIVLFWGWWAMPSQYGLHDRDPDLPGEGDLLDFARWLDKEAGVGGLVLNCSQQPVDILLLPQPMRARYQTAGNQELCQQWATEPESPDGRLLFLTVHDPYDGRCMGECAGIEPQELGWSPIVMPPTTPPGVVGWERAATAP